MNTSLRYSLPTFFRINMPYIQKTSIMIYVILFLSGLFGCYIAIFAHSTWQVCVESGQVLAGIVKYPKSNPFHMYHLKLWTILNQISALLLYIGISEKAASIIICGLLGCISFQALSLVVFAFSRNAVLSLFSPFFIYSLNYVGSSTIYPIWLMGSEHSYGVLGLSSILLIIALIGNGRYKLGGFLLGMAPAIHPSLGTFCVFTVFIAVLWASKDTQENLKILLKYFLFGGLVSGISLAYQLYVSREVPNIDPSTAKHYLSAFATYWDEHRRVVPLRLLWCHGMLICVTSLLVSVFVLRFSKEELPIHSRFFLKAIIVSAVLSISLSLTTLLPPRMIPTILLVSMPGRYINLNNLAFVVLIIGILGTNCSRNVLFNKLILCVFVLSASSFKVLFHFLPNIVSHDPQVVAELKLSFFNASYDIGIVLMLSSSIALVASRFFSNRLQNYLSNRYQLINLIYRITLLVLIMVGVAVLFKTFDDNGWEIPNKRFRNWSNDPMYAEISKGNGVLLAGAVVRPIRCIQLCTRRPVLVDVWALNFVSYVPEAAPELNNILKHVYGSDLLMPPPDEYRNSGDVPNVHKDLWESRSREEWLEIKQRFGVSDILTHLDWKLNLPAIMQNETYVLYRIH